TGEIKWTYNPDLPPLENLGICCGQTNRGVAFGDGKIFIAQLDSTLVALDAANGNVLWKIAIDLWENSKTETLAPLYANGKVIVGLSCAEFFCRGHVTAYSAADGTQLWRFYTIPGPGEFGNEDRKSTRLNSSHVAISYAVFCLKKKTKSQSQVQ